MSKLAASLSGLNPTVTERVRKGPQGACHGQYPIDMDDWAEVERIRLETSWREAQRVVDAQLGLSEPLNNDKFRYHWRRRCQCWPVELRLS